MLTQISDEWHSGPVRQFADSYAYFRWFHQHNYDVSLHAPHPDFWQLSIVKGEGGDRFSIVTNGQSIVDACHEAYTLAKAVL